MILKSPKVFIKIKTLKGIYPYFPSPASILAMGFINVQTFFLPSEYWQPLK